MPQGEPWLQTGLWIALSLSVPLWHLLATHTLQFLTHFSIMLLMAFLITDYYDPLSEVVPEDISRRICRFHNFVRKLPWLCSAVEAHMKNLYLLFCFYSMMQRCIMSEVRRSPFLACISRSWFWKEMPIINKGTEKIYFQLYRPVEYLISRIPLLNFKY